MKKKALRSNRNRHTGRLNSYKQWIIDHATHEKIMGGVRYVGSSVISSKGMFTRRLGGITWVIA